MTQAEFVEKWFTPHVKPELIADLTALLATAQEEVSMEQPVDAGAVISKLRAIVKVWPTECVADSTSDKSEIETRVSLADILADYDALAARLVEVSTEKYEIEVRFVKLA